MRVTGLGVGSTPSPPPGNGRGGTSVLRRNDNLLELLLETQVLDRVQRSGFVLRGVADPESVAEHSWHVAFLLWALAERVPGVDAARAVEIALVHDLAELRLGALPRPPGRHFPAG